MNSVSRPPSWPEWASDGYIRPLFSTRVEWKAKELVRRVRGLTRTPAPTSTFALDPVYRLAASPNPSARAAVLGAAFQSAVEPVQAIDAIFAALALALAAGHRPRSEAPTPQPAETEGV